MKWYLVVHTRGIPEGDQRGKYPGAPLCRGKHHSPPLLPPPATLFSAYQRGWKLLQVVPTSSNTQGAKHCLQWSKAAHCERLHTTIGCLVLPMHGGAKCRLQQNCSNCWRGQVSLSGSNGGAVMMSPQLLLGGG